MPSRLQVFKFGGSSVATSEAVRLGLARVQESAPRLVIVVSAMQGITDLLIDAVRSCVQGSTANLLAAARTFDERHRALIAQLITSVPTRRRLESMLERSTRELQAIGQSVAILRELTPRTLDAAVARGERVLANVFAAFLDQQGVRAQYVDATRILSTLPTPEGPWPDLARCARAATRALLPLLRRRIVPILPGFIARGPSGEVVTLGRGGSDFSAAVLAHALRASSVTLFKDVDGLMTADPREVPDARVLPALHYREASELAYYGARVLHPRTLIPLVAPGIPLFIRNTFNPGLPGTRIAADVPAGEYPVKALSAVRGQALVSIEGRGMIGVPGIAARTFAALRDGGHSVTMISQASSEASICFVLPGLQAPAAVAALEREFKPELDTGLIDAIHLEKNVALLAVVGLGMAGRPGIAARTTAPLARERINIRAIAQGSSELNITLALAEPDLGRALRALHREMQLDKIRPLPDTTGREASLALFGLGQIGRALARQLVRQQRYFHELGLEPRVVAVADRSGLLVQQRGFSGDELESFCALKESGRFLVRSPSRRAASTPVSVGADPAAAVDRLSRECARSLWPVALPKPVFVDLTALDDVSLIQQALEHGFHVVLANKKPLAAPQAQFDALFQTARKKRLALRYEATVGAGLPVLDTLRKLEEAGDRVQCVLGCLSGTLGYLMTQIEEGVPFSRAVREAHRLGYTEPDPREDLSGMDVARKALILARTIGRRLDLSDIAVERLFPEALAGLAPGLFLERIDEVDAEMAARVKAARRRGKVLRYVARIDPEAIRVGIEEVPDSSPTGRLRGPENQIVLHTDRYRANPLVVTGPGAGAEVTAAGVLNDILAIASGQGHSP